MASVTRPNVVFHGRLATLRDAQSRRWPSHRQCRLWGDWPSQRQWQSLHNVYVLSYLADMGSCMQEAKRPVSGQKRFVLLQDRTPIESVAEMLGSLDVRTPERLHVARLECDSEQEFVGRFVAALHAPQDEGAIMDAWWDDQQLVVISPLMQRMRIPLGKLGTLHEAKDSHWRAFTIDPMGAFLHWSAMDLHLGWSQLRQLVDPVAMLRAKQHSEAFNRRYGQAIRALREAQQIRQSAVAGLDARSVRRIEKGQTRATSNALAHLARAHGLSPTHYMNELANVMAASST